MESIYCSIIGKDLTRLFYGTYVPAIREGDEDAAGHCLETAWEAGFRVFDTAHLYGRAEKNLGAWLSSKNRDEIVILDKGCNPGMIGSDDMLNRDTILRQLDQSLHDMHTDYVDIYLLHRDDPSTPVDEVVDTLNDLKRQGTVRMFGGSNWQYTRIREACDYAEANGLTPFEAAGPAMSFVPMVSDPWGGSICLGGEGNAASRQWYQKKQMYLFTYSALARGFCTGKYSPLRGNDINDCFSPQTIEAYGSPENIRKLQRAEEMAEKKGCTVSQICLAYLLHMPYKLYPIVTSQSDAHIKEIAASVNIHLSDAEYAQLADE